MKDLYLNDLFCLSNDEIANSKIALNMVTDKSNNVTAFQEWEESDSNDRYVDFSYWSHYGDKRNFKVGQLCFGFVQLPGNNKKWLLVTAGQIVNIPDKPHFCEYETITKYLGFLGRLVVEIDKGNTYSRYVFNLSSYLNRIKVIELLSHDYQKIKFNGYENVQLSYHDLNIILESNKYAAYKEALSHVKGIYCLTDTKAKEKKLYIGSAYGERGLAQRWDCYINTKTGGNKALIELYQEKGPEYFEENFKFTLIEYFGLSVSNEKILEREIYWKDAFDTKDQLNCN